VAAADTTLTRAPALEGEQDAHEHAQHGAGEIVIPRQVIAEAVREAQDSLTGRDARQHFIDEAGGGLGHALAASSAPFSHPSRVLCANAALSARCGHGLPSSAGFGEVRYSVDAIKFGWMTLSLSPSPADDPACVHQQLEQGVLAEAMGFDYTIPCAWPSSSPCSTTSAGRLEVGIGRGSTYNEYEYVGFGLRSDDSHERMDEAVDVLTRLERGAVRPRRQVRRACSPRWPSFARTTWPRSSACSTSTDGLAGGCRSIGRHVLKQFRTR